jgi:hypothetical protein
MLVTGKNETRIRETIISKVKDFADDLAKCNNKSDKLSAIYETMMKWLDDAWLRLTLCKSLECYYAEKDDVCCLGDVRYLALDAEKQLEKEVENGETD